MKSTQGLTFFIKDNSRWVNVLVSVEEFKDGRLVISAKCKNDCIGKRDTSIDNEDIVSTYGNHDENDAIKR